MVVAHLDDVLRILDFVVGQFGKMEQPFEARFQLNENAEIGEFGDLARFNVAGAITAGNVAFPRDRWPFA